MKYRIRPTTFVCTECGGHRPKLFDFLSEEDGGRTTLRGKICNGCIPKAKNQLARGGWSQDRVSDHHAV